MANGKKDAQAIQAAAKQILGIKFLDYLEADQDRDANSMDFRTMLSTDFPWAARDIDKEIAEGYPTIEPDRLKKRSLFIMAPKMLEALEALEKDGNAVVRGNALQAAYVLCDKSEKFYEELHKIQERALDPEKSAYLDIAEERLYDPEISKKILQLRIQTDKEKSRHFGDIATMLKAIMYEMDIPVPSGRQH